MIGQTQWSISTKHWGCSAVLCLLSSPSLSLFQVGGEERRAGVFMVLVLVPAELVSVLASGQRKGQCHRVCLCVCTHREIKARPGALLWGPCSISIRSRPDRPRWWATTQPDPHLSFLRHTDRTAGFKGLTLVLPSETNKWWKNKNHHHPSFLHGLAAVVLHDKSFYTKGQTVQRAT